MLDESAPEEGNPEAEYAPDIPDESAASPELQRTFWVTVAVANLAVLGVSVGLLLVGFRGNVTYGGGALAVGLVATAYAVARYRSFTRNG